MTNLQLPPEPLFVEGQWNEDAPAIQFQITFDQLMDRTVVPALASWVLKIDGLVRPVSLRSWQDDFTLGLESGPGAQPLVDVTLELIVEDPNLRSTLHKTVQPFGPVTLPEA